MSFVTSAICGEALRWFHSLETRGIDNKNWDTVKAQIIILFGTHINVTYKAIHNVQ